MEVRYRILDHISPGPLCHFCVKIPVSPTVPYAYCAAPGSQTTRTTQTIA
jgi:hypothetical protein